MRMNFGTVFAGAALILLTTVFMTLGISTLNFQPPPSNIARPMTEQEARGRQVYKANGCVYCHSQYVRPQDWNAAGGGKASRVADAGDYVFYRTMLLGTERTGPDLSQEGGVHPDDWHEAHFDNPRYVNPNSIMPQFSYIIGQERADLIAYVQSLGLKAADVRVGTQNDEKRKILATYGNRQIRGNYEQQHIDYLVSQVPATWKDTKSAVPASPRSVIHGRAIYQTNCLGCHGTQGYGDGPAAKYLAPPPFNLHDANALRQASDGQMYHFLLFGLPGSAMPAFGDYLTVNDIWDTVNFLRTVPNGSLDMTDAQFIEAVNSGKLKSILPNEPSQYDDQTEQSYYGKPNVTPGAPKLTPAQGLGAQDQQNINNGNVFQNTPLPLPTTAPAK